MNRSPIELIFVSVEDHERVITNKNIRQLAPVSSEKMKAPPAAEPAQTPPESSVKDSYRDKVMKSRTTQQLPVSKTSEPASASSSCDSDFQLPGWERKRDQNNPTATTSTRDSTPE